MLCHNNKGFTLTEVLIALVIGLILISGVTATYIAQNRSYVAQESVSEVNTQSKIAHDLIANSIRGAGFGTPDDMDEDPVNGLSDIIIPFDSDAAPDAVTVVGGFRMIGTIWPSGVGPGGACPDYLEMEDSTLDIILSGTTEPNTTDRRHLTLDGIQYVQATSVASGGGSITFDPPLPRYFPLVDTNGDNKCDEGRPIYLVEDVTYCVAADATLHRIWRNANAATCTAGASSDDEVIAENIEDLQLAYAVDADNDGQMDDADADGQPDYVDGSAVADFGTIRAVRINVLARSDRPDPNFFQQGNPPGQIENRAHAVTDDNFRRRWWRTTVKVRNAQ